MAEGTEESENDGTCPAGRREAGPKASQSNRDKSPDKGADETENKDKSAAGRKPEGFNTSLGTKDRSLDKATAGAIPKRARIPTWTSAEDHKESAKNRDRSLDEGGAKTEIRDESPHGTSALDQNTSKMDRDSSSGKSSGAVENKGKNPARRNTTRGEALPGVTGGRPYKHTATENGEDRMQAGESTALAGTKSKCPDKGAGATKNKGKSSDTKSAVDRKKSCGDKQRYKRKTASETEEDKIPAGTSAVDYKALAAARKKSSDKDAGVAKNKGKSPCCKSAVDHNLKDKHPSATSGVYFDASIHFGVNSSDKNADETQNKAKGPSATSGVYRKGSIDEFFLIFFLNMFLFIRKYFIIRF